MANPAVSGTLEYWITDRINMRVIRPISVHIGAFEGWITDRIPYPEYQAQLTYQTMTGSLTPTGALVIQTQKVLAGSITPTGTLIKQAQKILTGGLTLSGALLKQTQKILVGSLTPTGTLIKQTQKVLAGTLTSFGTLVSVYIPAAIAVAANEMFKSMWNGITKRMRGH